MASRTTNTMSEGLVKMLQTITEMKLMPDADIEFLIGLETQVMQKAREPFESVQGGGATGLQPPAAGGAVGAPAQPLPAGGPAGVAGGGVNAPDELRRALGR